MRSGNATDGDLRFATQNANLLRAALGYHPQGDLPLTRELAMYRTNINLPGDDDGIRGQLEEPAPSLGIQIDGIDILPDEIAMFADTVADGPAGTVGT